MEAVDAELADAGLGAAIDDQLGHHRAGAGPELEAVRREAELVKDALATALGPTTGMSSGIFASMPAQARTMVALRITGNSSHTVRGADRELLPVEHRLVAVAIGRGEMAAADHARCRCRAA